MATVGRLSGWQPMRPLNVINKKYVETCKGITSDTHRDTINRLSTGTVTSSMIEPGSAHPPPIQVLLPSII